MQAWAILAPMSHTASTTIDPAEIANFTAIAEDWWEPEGRLKPLHDLNPLRIAYIRDTICQRLGRSPLAPKPLQGLRIADIGCGGGILTEPLARLGASVVGVDPGTENIAVAARHAAEGDLEIDYRIGTAEALVLSGERFDAVVAMELVEHVADVNVFLEALAGLLRPEGILFMSTLNRTPKSFALAIVGAEYILGWVPRGTHDWRKFLRPSELAAGLRRHGVTLRDTTGIVYGPLSQSFRLDKRNLAVNYMLWGKRG